METWSAPIGDGSLVHVRVTERGDGDLSISGDPRTLEHRRRAVVDRPWVWLDQVHGSEVVTVAEGCDIGSVNGRGADGIVTARRDVAIAAHSADCATVALWSPEGIIAVAHAGWRGLRLGVVGATAEAMRSIGATSIRAVAGPHVGVECYEFSAGDLDELAIHFGPRVVGESSQGTPALDVAQVLAIELERSSVELLGSSPECTACESDRFWSHRARGDLGRQALVVWITP